MYLFFIVLLFCCEIFYYANKEKASLGKLYFSDKSAYSGMAEKQQKKQHGSRLLCVVFKKSEVELVCQLIDMPEKGGRIFVGQLLIYPDKVRLVVKVTFISDLR